MISGANTKRFVSLKDHLADNILVGHDHYPNKREYLVGLLNCWKIPSTVNNKNTAIK